MVSPAMTRSILAGPVCTAAARTGGGHPRCPKRSMNTGLGEQGVRRLSVGSQLRVGVTPLKSEG